MAKIGNNRQFLIILVADRWRLGLGLPKKRASILLFSTLPLSPKRGKKSLEYVSIGFHMEGWTDAGTDRQTDGWAV